MCRECESAAKHIAGYLFFAAVIWIGAAMCLLTLAASATWALVR